MKISFYKYQGTGNDFIMLDNRDGAYSSITVDQIQQLCDRKFGIGADGLIMLNQHDHYAFEVDYSNADGTKSFCGNGARCSVAFAQLLGIDCSHTQFLAIDGEHQARMDGEEIAVLMQNVIEIQEDESGNYTLNTGSPHFIRFTDDLAAENVVEYGKYIRYSPTFYEKGINVNLVQASPKGLLVYTYERGVEDETLSCGTGVTAAALAWAFKHERKGFNHVDIQTKGGNLAVSFEYLTPHQFINVWLKGPAELVFKGEFNG